MPIDNTERRLYVAKLYASGVRTIKGVKAEVEKAGFAFTSERNIHRDIRAAQEAGNIWVGEIGDHGFALLYKTSYEKLEEIERNLQELADGIDLNKSRDAEVKANILEKIVSIQEKKADMLLQGPMMWSFRAISKKYPLTPEKKLENSVVQRLVSKLPGDIDGQVEVPA